MTPRDVKIADIALEQVSGLCKYHLSPLVLQEANAWVYSDFADQHPESEVIGLDISPPAPHWIPVNLKFEVDDITQEWTYPADNFDYIHMRWLVGSIADWTALYKEIFRALKPGGIFEHKESSCVIQSDDGSLASDSALAQWGKVFVQAGTKFGRSFSVVEENIQQQAMAAAGFVDIKTTEMKVNGKTRYLAELRN